MNYRETYDEISRNVNKEINEIAKDYTEDSPKEIQFTIHRQGVYDDYDIVAMWWDKENKEVYFYISEFEEPIGLDCEEPVALCWFDLDTKIDILDYLKSLA
jgi:hypothetical protein